MNWEKDYKGISVSYEDRIVRVVVDEALLHYFYHHNSNAYRLAAHIRKQYRRKFGKELQITTASLGIELLGHVYVDRFAHWLAKQPVAAQKESPARRFADFLTLHLDVIDCGERAVDDNRFVWDGLEKPVRLLRKLLSQANKEK